MRGMEMMLANILQQMGVDPVQLKAVAQSTVEELKVKVASIDFKLDTILELCQQNDARLVRLETKFNTLPLDEIIAEAINNGVLVLGSVSHGGSNGTN